MFPLGEVASKEEVRAEAAARGLSVSAKPDSYDICFVADGDTRGFLRSRLGERPGEVVDTYGAVLGQHDGAYGFTVGQRRGRSGCPAADGSRGTWSDEPVANRVVVGSAACWPSTTSWRTASSGSPTTSTGRVRVDLQIRAHGAAVSAGEVLPTARVPRRCAGALRGVAPGQSSWSTTGRGCSVRRP